MNHFLSSPWRFVFCGLLAACCAVCAEAATPAAGDRWAVLIGVDDYAKLRPLGHAVSDMRALANQFVAGGFEQDHVYVLADKAEKAAFLPSKRNIEERLDLVLSLVKPNDLVVVGFAGHGVEVNGKPYWCPMEAIVDGDDADVAQTLVPLDAVYQKLAGCPAALRLIVVDACRDDPRRTRSGTPMKLDLVAQALANPPEGILVLNSCGSGERSQEDAKLGHGVFTHFLMDGLNGGADADSDGAISLGELFEHAGTRTKKYVADELAEYQSPKLSGEVSPGVLRFPVAITQPAGTVIVNSIGMKLVRIKAGEFQMGSGETAEHLKAAGFTTLDGFDPSDEAPVHRVRITKPFFMGAHEVTLGQFLKFYHDGHEGKLDCERDGEGGWGYDPKDAEQPFAQKSKYRPWSWGHPNQTNDHPVVNVSWNDATAFCAWLSRKEGKKYRLPTEAEWEYACRAGTTARFWNGDDAEGVTTIDNVLDGTLAAKVAKATAFATGARDGHAFTAQVGTFRENAFGLHDMHGNVFEWCSDWYDADYYKQFTGRPAIDPQGASAGSFRVIRGGSWVGDPVFCRSAYRNGDTPTNRNPSIGFRVVCELE